MVRPPTPLDPGLTARERLALEFVDRFNANPPQIDEAFLKNVRAAFTTEEAAELEVLVMAFGGLHRGGRRVQGFLFAG